MEDLAKMYLRQWPNFDQICLKDFFRGSQSSKNVEEFLSERDLAIAERDAALVEKQSANSERDSALLQRDIAYADRHAAWVERDNALAELSMLQANESNPESTAQLMQVVNIAVNRFPIESNLLGYPATNGLGNSNIEGKLPQRRAKEWVWQAEEEMTSKQKENGVTRQVKDENGAVSPAKKGSKVSKKRRKQVDGPINGENIEREDASKSVVLCAAPVHMSLTAIPYCSCTGISRSCYRWGNGGWQSACCTNLISEYPLPMNHTKQGARVAGRKMTIGAFKKLLERLAGEGVNVTQPIDLKDHWAKHGTNRYITVR